MRVPVPPSVHWLAAAAALLLAITARAQCPPNPSQAGPIGRPATVFDPLEYARAQSSINLQGQPARVKYSAGAFYYPGSPFNDFRMFTSIVVVNNPQPDDPDPTVQDTANVSIEYYDQTGQLLGTTPIALRPNESYAEGASVLNSTLSNSPGLGSVRVVSDLPIVGATLHHTIGVDVPGFGLLADTERDGERIVGASSYQQLQMAQPAATVLHWGPIPFTNSSASDFLNGTAPLFQFTNTHSTTATVMIEAHSTSGMVVIPPSTFVLPPMGSRLETRAWYAFMQQALIASGTGTFYDFGDVYITVQSTVPIVGEGIMLDAFGDSPDLSLGLVNLDRTTNRKFRMASMSAACEPSDRLYCGEFTSNSMVTTLIGIFNAGSAPVGPVTVEYFDRNTPAGGMPVATTTVAALPPHGTVRILPGTPGYPTLWNGWVRISAGCNGDRLCGWTIREIGDANPPIPQQFHKAYGEELIGANGAEPGTGAIFNDASPPINGGPIARQVMPFVRVNLAQPISGYTTAINGLARNIGAYYFRFYTFGVAATPPTDCTLYCPQSFAGLPWARASLTYEDSDPSTLGCPPGLVQGFSGVVSGRIDRPARVAERGPHGITVIGGSLRDFDPHSPNYNPIIPNWKPWSE